MGRKLFARNLSERVFSSMFLRGVLSKCKKENASETLQAFQLELFKLKQSLYETIGETKTNVNVAENERLVRHASLLKEKTMTIIENISNLSDKVNNCATDINDSTESLCNVNLKLDALDRLVNISDLLNNLQKHKDDNKFQESALCLISIQNVLSTCSDLATLTFFDSLYKQIEGLREELMSTMREIWNENVIFNISIENNNKTVGIVVNKLNSSIIRQVVQAVLLLQNTDLLEKFFFKVKDSILLPAIKYYCEVRVEEKNDIALLSVTIKEGSGAPPYWKNFEIIKLTVNFLKSFISEDIIEPMGQNMAHEVVSSLVKLSLSEAVLSPSGKLNSFEEIVKHAENFQASLQELGFLPKQYVSVLNETDSAALFFAEKMYLAYLERARYLMKSDLHNIIQSKELSMPNWNIFPADVLQEIKAHFNINNESKSLVETHSISKSAQDVLELIDTILSELKKTDGSQNRRLMFSVRNIFEMYGAIVPLHHAKLLSTIPQHVAIFHNNCLYFAFRLILLASECLGEWQVDLRDDYHIFLDQAAEMRRIGVTILQLCVSGQQKQILSIITTSGLVRLRTNPKLEEDTDRSLRQCIRQLELLGNVWISVLPETVYSNTMGFLIDEFTQAIVAQVTAVEDISQKSATDLVQLFNIAEERLPAVFKDPREVHRLCRKWSRFKELIFVLKNNLDAFSERWASGLGPLANEFSKTEAQQLVRALFRNTPRRAAVLSHIYNR